MDYENVIKQIANDEMIENIDEYLKNSKIIESIMEKIF